MKIFLFDLADTTQHNTTPHPDGNFQALGHFKLEGKGDWAWQRGRCQSAIWQLRKVLNELYDPSSSAVGAFCFDLIIILLNTTKSEN